MKKIEDHIHLLNSAKSAQEVFDSFTKIMEEYGYDRVAYGFATDHPSLGLTRMHGHLNCFPEDWMKHYQQNSLIEIDPIPAYILKSPKPAFWCDLNINNDNMPSKSRQFMYDARDVGLKEGVMVPLYSRGGEIAGVSVSCDDHDRSHSYETLAAINLLSVYFHEAYKSFLRKDEPVELSAKEYELLSHAIDGKKDHEIASILGRSLPAIRHRWNGIFKKLDAYSRTYAISKAIRLQLVVPYSLMKNQRSR